MSGGAAGVSRDYRGLISAIRPITKVSAQLEKEYKLLCRFKYTNKNQHKQQAWWRRLVHVQRLTSSLLDQLNNTLYPALGTRQVKSSNQGEESGE